MMVKIDYGLLYLRSENARMSLKFLSKKIKKTPQRLKYSISTLEKEGILKEPYCVFDYSYFGLVLFRVYFRGGHISEKDKANIITELKNNPYVVSIYELTGEFELTVEFASPNPSKFNKELKNITMLIPKLNDYKIILNLVTHIFPKHFLIKDEDLYYLNTEKVIGGDREIESFNSNEMKLMKTILINPIATLTDLANASNLNIKTVKSILKNITKRNVIKGFKYIIDTEKLGINKFRLFLRLHYLSPERETQFMNYILNTREIVQVNKTVGDWDIELDIESFDKSKVRHIIIKFREEFKDIIEKFNLIEFFNTYKRSYLPMYIFNREK